MRSPCFLLADHVFGEPYPTIGVNVDANTDTVQGRTEQVDAVPTIWWLVGHAFLDGVHPGPGGWIWAGLGDILAAVIQVGKTLVGDALVLRHPIGAGMAEATVIHIPAVQERARCQCTVPGERRQTTGGAVAIDQLEKLLSELLRFAGDRRGAVGSR